MVLLQRARNVKYKSFLAPGMRITYEVQVKSLEDQSSRFLGAGTVDGNPILEARFELRHFNLAEKNPKLADRDHEIVTQLKKRLALIQ
jgi:3-hydroxyacyl-[acyl-carrier-protein] dehydratase